METENKGFWWFVFSENGRPSSKRVVGTLIFLITLIILTYLSLKEGCTDNIKDIINLEIITAGALLGISSVTSIWKEKKKEE